MTAPAGARRSALLVLAGAAAGRSALAVALAARPRAANAAPPWWVRSNYAGRPVSLLGGPALAVAATAGAVLGAPRGSRAAAAVVGTVSGVVGGYDDVAGARADQHADKGLAGHLRALRSGRISAGAVKAVGIGSAAAAAALLADADAGAGGVADRLLGTGLVAGTANLLNLLDLRPGRAAKAAILAAGATLRGPAAGLVAGPLGALVVVLPADLAERVMLGDCGANAAGALIGLRLAAVPGRTTRALLLAVVALLTLASERVSFSAVIDSTPVLRGLDRLGRRAA